MARTSAPKTPDRHTVDTAADVEAALAWLKKHGTKANRDGMARYAIVADKVFGVSVMDIRRLGKRWACATIWPSRCGRPAGTKRACWSRSSPTRHA